MSLIRKILAALFLLLASMTIVAASHHVIDGTFSVTKVADGLYMLQGKGGNVGVSVGEDGMLVVDDEYASLSDALDTELRKLGGDRLRFLLNTHWHGDHTGGNARFGEHASIVAHSNVRKRLMSRQEIKHFNMVQEPQPKQGLPIITFDDALSFHFNGQEVKAEHFPGGHTDGDIIVFFEGSNVVHMGDHYFARMFPFVDLDSGGNVLAMARNVKQVIDRLPEDVKIIPGHGPLSTLGDLRNYHRMLVGTTEYVRTLKDNGMSLEQIQDKGMEATWDDWANGFIGTRAWIQFIYHSL